MRLIANIQVVQRENLLVKTPDVSQRTKFATVLMTAKMTPPVMN
jgi:hypothetical protein